jgi:hypothetical protein
MINQVLSRELKALCWKSPPGDYQRKELRAKLQAARKYVEAKLAEANTEAEIHAIFTPKLGGRNPREVYTVAAFLKAAKGDKVVALDMLSTAVDSFDNLYPAASVAVTEQLAEEARKQKVYEAEREEIRAAVLAGTYQDPSQWGDSLREALGGD